MPGRNVKTGRAYRDEMVEDLECKLQDVEGTMRSIGGSLDDDGQLNSGAEWAKAAADAKALLDRVRKLAR